MTAASFAPAPFLGFYDLPTDLLHLVMSQWITTADLARLDAGTLNSKDRAMYLALIQTSHFQTPGLDETTMSNDYFQWLLSRKVRIRSLNLTNPTRTKACTPSQSATQPQAFTAVLQLKHFVNEIERLHVDFSCTRLSTCALNILGRSARKVKFLSIKSDISDQDILSIVSAADPNQGFPSIRRLDASLSRVSHTFLCKLWQVCPNLEDANLACADGMRNATIASLAKNCPRLRNIVLDDCTNIDDEALAELAQRCPRLHSLSLRRCDKITDIGVSTLASKLKENLNTIHLACCSKITDEALIKIVEYAHKIEHLDLSFCPSVSDAALEALATHCTSLNSISLNFCPRITSQGVEKAKELSKSLRNIQAIHLSR